MAEANRYDAWLAGDSYDPYMGRWSRQVAPRFLDWLDPPEGLEWLEVGCGTGALSAAILARCNPNASFPSILPWGSSLRRGTTSRTPGGRSGWVTLRPWRPRLPRRTSSPRRLC